MVLIDTSCWTQALRRKGDPAIRSRVQALLTASQAAWCNMVRLELWNGAASDWDKKLLRHLEATIPSIPITDDVWQLAVDLSIRARSSAVSVPATDLIIFACARVHGVRLEHVDRHYELLEQVK